MAYERTSREAYAAIAATGMLTGTRLEVYRWYCQNEDIYDNCVTRAELKAALDDTRDSFAPRQAELEQIGLIEPAGEKEDQETGMMNKGWRTVIGITPQRARELIESYRHREEAKKAILSPQAALNRTIKQLGELRDMIDAEWREDGEEITRRLQVIIQQALNRRRSD